MNKWMGYSTCVFGIHFYVRRERVLEFIIPFDLRLRRCAVPAETSELIKRAVSHYLLAKQSRDGVAVVIRAVRRVLADGKCNFRGGKKTRVRIPDSNALFLLRSGASS